MSPGPVLQVDDLSKRFVLHNQGAVHLAVLEEVAFELFPGECLALDGPSGAGKSTLLKLIYGNYLASTGSIRIRPPNSCEVDVARASPRSLLALRKGTIGYVSQFLRSIPRVGALDVVAEPLLDAGGGSADSLRSAHRAAQGLLLRLRIPQRLWHVPPATFSGGEQQRVNIARCLIRDWPVLLLDEPTASLDAANTETVIALVNEARSRGTAVLGIFHDASVRERLATRVLDMSRFQPRMG